jgi:hypothetical protein
MFPFLGSGFSTAWWGLVELLWIALIGIIGSVLAVLFVALLGMLLMVGMLWCCGLALVAAGPLGACLLVVWWDEASGENDLRLALEDEP